MSNDWATKEWRPCYLRFVGDFLEHQGADELPSERRPLPEVPRGSGYGSAREAFDILQPHVLEEALAGLREERQRGSAARPVAASRRCVATSPTRDAALLFFSVSEARGDDRRRHGGGSAPGDWGEGTVVAARDGKARYFGFVVHETDARGGKRGAKSAARVAFLAKGGPRAGDFDFAVVGDALTAVREYQALAALEGLPPRLRDPLLAKKVTPSAARPPARAPAALWEKLKSGHNDSQFQAIAAAATADPYALVQGPPGTGKTKTIGGMVSALLFGDDVVAPARPARFGMLPGRGRGGGTRIAVGGSLSGRARAAVSAAKPPSRRLLIAAPSNAAVDEVALRLHTDGVVGPDGQRRDIRICRVGVVGGQRRDDKVAADGLEVLEPFTLDRLAEAAAEGEKKKGLGERRAAALARCDVVLATLSGCGCAALVDAAERLAPSALFDALVVDEAAQAVETSTLIPLKYGPRRVVLVGDPDQLSATLLSPKTRDRGFGQSLFERLWRGGRRADMLQTQYRMHRDLCAVVSDVFYHGRLRSADVVTAESHALPPALVAANPWFGDHLAFHDVAYGTVVSRAASYANGAEVEFVARILEVVLARAPELHVAVIAAYKAQTHALRDRLGALPGPLRAAAAKVEVATVDAFQGREKDLVLVSCVRAPACGKKDRPQTIGFLKDRNRLNVLLSRARLGCWVVGHGATLKQNGDWKDVLNAAQRLGAYHAHRSLPGTFATAGGGERSSKHGGKRSRSRSPRADDDARSKEPRERSRSRSPRADDKLDRPLSARRGSAPPPPPPTTTTTPCRNARNALPESVVANVAPPKRPRADSLTCKPDSLACKPKRRNGKAVDKDADVLPNA